MLNFKMSNTFTQLVAKGNNLRQGFLNFIRVLYHEFHVLGKCQRLKSSKRKEIAEFFDTSWYLSQNPDVKAKNVNPIDHYIEYGWREGRWPNQVFDPSWYVETYSDITKHNLEPFKHFLRHGRFEGRRPSAIFDQASYLRLNLDVANGNIEPFAHFMQHGRHEGRRFSDRAEEQFSSTLAYLRPVEDTVHVSPVIFAMRDKAAISLDSLPREAVTEAVRILTRFDEVKLEWQRHILSKTIYRLDDDATPTPDGLSYAYLELADALNDGYKSINLLSYDERIALAQTDPLGAFAALMQRELGETSKLQAKLFHNRNALCSS